MTNSFRSLLVGVVALAATSAVFGQNRMTANIGFPFKMQSATLPAGSYEVIPSEPGSGSKHFVLRSSTESVIVVPRYLIEESKVVAGSSEPRPRLVFKCDSHTCALAEIWTPDGGGYAAPKPKLSPAEKERLAVVPLNTTKAD
jgi:hypothetical protein